MNKKQWFPILRFAILIFKEMETLTEQQVNDVLEGRLRIKLLLEPKDVKQLREQTINVSKTKKTTGKDDVEKEVSIDDSQNDLQQKVHAIEKKLNTLDNRDEGFAILDKFCHNKKDLQVLANHLDLPSRSNSQNLRERIIEATIGYRLNSKAIRGKIIPRQTTELRQESSQEDQIKQTNVLQTQEKIISKQAIGIAQEPTQENLSNQANSVQEEGELKD